MAGCSLSVISVDHNGAMVTIALNRSPQSSTSRWRVRLATLVLWMAAAGVLAYWALKLGAGGDAALAPVPAPSAMVVEPAAMARALGVDANPVAAQAVPAAPSRYALLGVYAGRDSGGGAAVIAVGGQPAKAYKVGAQVDEGLVLQSLSAREARLGASPGGPASMTLNLVVPGGR